MHEIVHLLLSHEAARVDVNKDNLLLLNTYGKQQDADWLAATLLLPRDAILAIARPAGTCGWPHENTA
jgi:hypothetical protein